LQPSITVRQRKHRTQTSASPSKSIRYVSLARGDRLWHARHRRSVPTSTTDRAALEAIQPLNAFVTYARLRAAIATAAAATPSRGLCSELAQSHAPWRAAHRPLQHEALSGALEAALSAYRPNHRLVARGRF
jgi:hypothetical protein